MSGASLEQKPNQSIRSFIRAVDEDFLQICGTVVDSEFESQLKKTWLFEGMREDISIEFNDDFRSPDSGHSWEQTIEAAKDAELLAKLRRRPRSTGYTRKNAPGFIRQRGFKIDNEGFVRVYTHGSCVRGNQSNPAAGIGVWFGHKHSDNEGEPLKDLSAPVTKSVVEIKAAIHAIFSVKKQKINHLAILTDSEDLVNSITFCIFSWLKNGWKREHGTEVEHKNQYIQLLSAMENIDIKWVYSPLSEGEEGSVEAERLARQGAKQYVNNHCRYN